MIREGALKAQGMKRAPKRFHDAQSLLCDVRRQIALLWDASKKDARLDLHGHLGMNVLKGPCGRSTAIPRQCLRDLSTETMTLRSLGIGMNTRTQTLAGLAVGKNSTGRPVRLGRFAKNYEEKRQIAATALSQHGIAAAASNDRRTKIFELWNYLHKSKTETADCNHMSLSIDALEVGFKKVNVVCVSLPEKRTTYWSPPMERSMY